VTPFQNKASPAKGKVKKKVFLEIP